MVELKVKHERKIERAIKKLNEAIKEVREYVLDANFNLEDGGNFNILSGSSS